MAKKTEETEEVSGDKALELALNAIEKQFGKGSVMVGDQNFPDVQVFSSQCKGLDRALGGGWARGRILEVFGPESSGKTTLCLHAIAEIQRTGGVAAFIDVEHALDPSYAASLGVDMDKLLLSQPDSAEQALEIVETLVRSGAVQLIVVDSVAALVPLKEIEGDMGDAQMGRQANLMSQAMRKLTGISAKTNCSIIFINQIRMKIGVMFGSPETTTGGNALKFYASQRVDIRRTGGVKDGEEFIGNTVRTKVVKNKIAPPFKEHEFQIIYGKGINIAQDTLTYAVEKGLIEKSGSWYSYKGERLGQGEDAVLALLQTNPAFLEEITKAL